LLIISMVDIVLFRPRFLYSRMNPPPIPWGPLYVGSALSRQGYTVTLIDELLCPDWRNRVAEILKDRPLCVGVSAMTGMQIEYGLRFTSFVKSNAPEVPVVWGGVHASLFPRQTLEHEAVDCVVVGEGEETAVEMLQCLEKCRGLDDVQGVGFKHNGRVHLNPERPSPDLDSLPRIDYSLIDVHSYIGNRFGAKRSFELCTSRGCPHACGFCYNARFTRRTWRSMSVDRIFSCLNDLITRYGVDAVTWREDNFFVDSRRVEEIARRIIRENIHIRWHADCRIDYVDRYDDAFLSLLKASGCHTLTLGAESGSDRILDRICKGITREQTLAVREKLSHHGIYQNYHFMLGLPGEDRRDVMQTLTLIDSLRRGNRFFGRICGPSLFTPYPGTDLYAQCLAMGLVVPDSLEGWRKMDWYSCHLSWMPRKQRKWLEDLAWTLMGMEIKWIGAYFAIRFRLFIQRNVWIPCFERAVFEWMITLWQRLRRVVSP